MTGPTDVWQPLLVRGVNAELKIPKSAEVKFPTFTGPVISRVQ